MKKKSLLLVMTIIIIAISASIFSLTVFNQTTEVNTVFISGTIPETTYKNPENLLAEWMTAYDSKNTNRYIFAMADSLKLFSEKFEIRGAKKIATQTYNGIEWNIYVITPTVYKNMFDESGYGYLCVASGKNGDYYIEVSSLILEADEALQSDLFTKYTKPLLESIEFKDPENPPKEYQLLGIGEKEYNHIKEYGWESYWDNFY